MIAPPGIGFLAELIAGVSPCNLPVLPVAIVSWTAPVREGQNPVVQPRRRAVASGLPVRHGRGQRPTAHQLSGFPRLSGARRPGQRPRANWKRHPPHYGEWISPPLHAGRAARPVCGGRESQLHQGRARVRLHFRTSQSLLAPVAVRSKVVGVLRHGNEKVAQ